MLLRCARLFSAVALSGRQANCQRHCRHLRVAHRSPPAYKVTDDDIVALRQAGYSEDAILQLPERGARRGHEPARARASDVEKEASDGSSRSSAARISASAEGHATGMIWVMTGRRAPDILRTLLISVELFGMPSKPPCAGPLSGASAERELFIFVLRKNQCPF